MRNTLLIIHILAAATWIGASATVAFLSPRLRKAGHEAAAAFMAGFSKMGRGLYPPAGIVVLVTGILLVVDTGYAFADPFVLIGIAAIVAGIFLGIRVFEPLSERIQKAHAARDETGVLDAAYRRFTAFGALDLGILAVAVFAMVTKLGV